jgi:hypothetical protein
LWPLEVERKRRNETRVVRLVHGVGCVSPKHYAWVTAALFAAVAAAVIVHLGVGGVIPGYTRGFSVFLDVVVAVVWIAATLAALAHRTWPGLFLALAASLVTVGYGVLFTVAYRAVGVLFVLAAGAQLFCVVHAARAFLEPEPEHRRASRPPILRALHRLRLRHSH